jgi:hypothetical protein
LRELAGRRASLASRNFRLLIEKCRESGGRAVRNRQVPNRAHRKTEQSRPTSKLGIPSGKPSVRLASSPRQNPRDFLARKKKTASKKKKQPLVVAADGVFIDEQRREKKDIIMKTTNSRTNTALHAPSRATLEEAPARALTFLRTIGLSPEIFATLKGAGYTKEVHQTGWTMLRAVAGVPSDSGGVTTPEPPNAATTAAVAEVETAVGPMFKRAQAALRHLHPAQEAFVFGDLHIGSQPILAMATYLARCDELKDGKNRKGSRKEDHAALATLEDRGLGADERKRMRALIAIAETPPDSTPTPPQSDDTTSERTANLVKLHAWVQDWSETARAVIKNRAWLIRLGAVKRRASTPPPPPVAPATQPDAPQMPQAVNVRLLPPSSSSKGA